MARATMQDKPGAAQRMFACLLLWSFCTGAHSADTVRTAEARSEISVDIGKSCERYLNYVERFTRFGVFNYGWNPTRHLLIKQEFEVGRGCFEGYDPQTVTVSAHELNAQTGKAAEAARWRFTAKGASGAFADYPLATLYRVDAPGCCDATPVSKYFSLSTGAFVVASSQRPLVVDIEDARSSRYFGVTDNTAADKVGPDDTIATVFLGDANGALQTVSIRGPEALRQEAWMATMLNFAGLDTQNNQLRVILNSPHMPPTNIMIELTCRCDRPTLLIDLPVRADRIDIDHARIAGAADIRLESTHATVTNPQPTEGRH